MPGRLRESYVRLIWFETPKISNKTVPILPHFLLLLPETKNAFAILMAYDGRDPAPTITSNSYKNREIKKYIPPIKELTKNYSAYLNFIFAYNCNRLRPKSPLNLYRENINDNVPWNLVKITLSSAAVALVINSN